MTNGTTAVQKPLTALWDETVNTSRVLAELSKVLPQELPPERFIRFAATTFFNTKELWPLLHTSHGRASFLNCLMRAAQAGLEPDGVLVHFIPRFDRNLNCAVCTVIFDYKGLLTLAHRQGLYPEVKIVFEGDEFEWIEDDGQGRTVVRHISRTGAADADKVLFVYSRLKLPNGLIDYERMFRDEIEHTRTQSAAAESKAWADPYWRLEQYKKTVLRRHSKRWPLRADVRQAFFLDDDVPAEVQQKQSLKFIPLKPQTTEPEQTERKEQNENTTQAISTAEPAAGI